MNFSRIEHAIDVCNKHLDATGTRGTEIESFLVRYLLVLICAEYEMCMEKIFEVRAHKSGDGHVISVVKTWAGSTTKRMKISDIKGHLGCFGTDYKNEFDGKLKTINLAVVAYDALQSNRHLVAHSLPPMITLVELEGYFQGSKPVLLALGESVNLTAAEITALSWP